MALSKEFTDEQLNYYRIYVTTDILAEGLREIFKREWDKLYKSTKGEWKDDPQNGIDFFKAESPRNQKRNAQLLATMKNGNREEWDCTMLFYGILFSDCVGPSLSTVVETNVENLRTFRNEQFAHMPRGSLSEVDFQNATSNVEGAFAALGLPTVKIQDITYQKTFPTKELEKVLQEVENLKQEVEEKEKQRQVLEDQLQNEAPSFCILPPKPSHEIGGRDSEVSKIIQQLRKLKDCNKNSLSYLYISGNPGSGKSQLAGLVAHKVFEEDKEVVDASSFVMTLNAESPDSLLKSYASFARQIKCPDYSVVETLNCKDWDVDDKITNLMMLIAAKIRSYTSWLLVVDNVTTMSSVRTHLPQSGNEAWARGQLLITTQDTTSIPSNNSFINHVSVSRGMEPDDARSLLAKLSGTSEKELGEKVAKKLDYQPLALASAAVFVKQIREDKASKSFGWDEYLKLLDKGKREATEVALASTNPVYPNSMTKAIMLAIETLIRSDKFVKHLFTFLSYCAPQPLNVDVAISYIMIVHEDVDKPDRELIQRKLRRCPLLLFEDDEVSNFIRLHQVVYDAIKSVVNENPKSQTPEVGRDVITSFSEFIAAIPPVNKQLDTMRIVPHLKALTVVTEKVFLKESSFQLHDKSMLENFAEICNMHCEFNGAKKYFEYLLYIELWNHGPEDLSVAKSYSNLASISRDLGDLKQAKEYQERCLAIEIQKLDPEDVSVATSYNNLASIYLYLGDLKQAEEYQQRSLAIQIEKLGPEHAFVATSYGNLATIYQNSGDLKQAKDCQQRCIAIQIKKLGSEDISVGTSYNNLAIIYQDLGELQQAKEYQQLSLGIKIEKLGQEHVSVAKSYNNLALIYLALGDLKQAKEHQERCLAIQIEKLGPEHVHVATSYGNLAVIYKDLGDLKQAKEYQQRSLAIEIEKLGQEHVSVAKSYNTQALIYQDLGDLKQAKEYQQRCLAILIKNLGPEHVSVAGSYGNLALIYKDLGDLKQAKEYQQRCLTVEIEKLGPEHVSVATSYGNLASIYQELGDLKQAMEYLQRGLAIQIEKLGPGHVSVATSYNTLASIYIDLGDLSQAKEYQQRCLPILIENLGPEHVSVATSYKNLALIDRNIGDLSQAKEYQQRVLAIETGKLGPEHVSVPRNYDKKAKKDKHKVGQKKQQKAKKGSDVDSSVSSEEYGYLDSKEVDYLSNSSSSSQEDLTTVKVNKPKAENDLNSEETSSGEEDELTQEGSEIKDMLEKDEGKESEDEEDPDRDEMKGTSALFLQAKAKKRPASAGKKGIPGEDGSPASKKPLVSPAPSSPVRQQEAQEQVPQHRLAVRKALNESLKKPCEGTSQESP